MKLGTNAGRHWKFWMWGVFGFLLMVFMFGASVQVPFVDPAVPFSKAVRHLDMGSALDIFTGGGELSLALISFAVGLMIYSLVASWKLRMLCLLAGVLAPLVIMEPVFVAMIWAGPLCIFGAIFGSPGGEFYNESILEASAIGTWMLVCLVSLIQEIMRLKTKKPPSRARAALKNQ